MLSRWMRKWDSVVLRPLVTFMAWLGMTPNLVTVASLLIVMLAGCVVASGRPVLGGALLLLGGFLDGLDGELARFLGKKTRFGAFLDSISDHLGDFAVYLGLLRSLLHGGKSGAILLLFAAMFGSLFGSQVRSRATMVGIDTREVGICTRLERVLILVAGLCFGKLTWALWALAALTNISALQRVMHVVAAARSVDDAAGTPSNQPS